jgi:methylthioribulose-1-phosphate dehydratase
MDAIDLKKEIVRISHLFYSRGWCLATSGNFSVRLGPDRVLITASGKDKGTLTEEEILLLGPDGRVLERRSEDSPSAESQLHCALYNSGLEINAILHTHSVYSTVVSSLPNLKAPLTIGGYEMLKAFRDVSTHSHTEQLPVFANDQNIGALSNRVLPYLKTNPSIHGFLIAGHGLYSWGSSISEALRHTEAFEFLLECEYRKKVASD